MPSLYGSTAPPSEAPPSYNEFTAPWGLDTSERASLISREPAPTHTQESESPFKAWRNNHIQAKWSIFLVFVFLFGATIGYSCGNDVRLDPAYRESILAKFEAERRVIRVLREELKMEQSKVDVGRRELENEGVAWHRRMEADRRQIKQERDESFKEIEIERGQLEKERIESQRKIAIERGHLEDERIEAQKKIAVERGRLEQEKVEWEEKREKERELRESFFWRDVTPAPICSAYGTREFTATIKSNRAVFRNDIIEYCYKTPNTIAGQEFSRPDNCEYNTKSGEAIGRWLVKGLPDCTSFFSDFRDKGCMGPGTRTRRYEAPLLNLPGSADWRAFCETTPAIVGKTSFSKPNSCSGPTWTAGTWGTFIINDPTCD